MSNDDTKQYRDTGRRMIIAVAVLFCLLMVVYALFGCTPRYGCNQNKGMNGYFPLKQTKH
jgi:hypothetical protein